MSFELPIIFIIWKHNVLFSQLEQQQKKGNGPKMILFFTAFEFYLKCPINVQKNISFGLSPKLKIAEYL